MERRKEGVVSGQLNPLRRGKGGGCAASQCPVLLTMSGDIGTPAGGLRLGADGLGTGLQSAEAPVASSSGGMRQGTMRNLGVLEGGLPDAGSLIALADVATDRLYVVMESEDGSLYLELSDLPASEELRNPDSAVRLAFRRTVRA